MPSNTNFVISIYWSILDPYMRKRHLTFGDCRIINAICSRNTVIWAKFWRKSYLCKLQSSIDRQIEELNLWFIEINHGNLKFSWRRLHTWTPGISRRKILLFNNFFSRMRSSFVVLGIGTVPLGHWSLRSPNMGPFDKFFTLVLAVDFWKLGFFYK